MWCAPRYTESVAFVWTLHARGTVRSFRSRGRPPRLAICRHPPNSWRRSDHSAENATRVRFAGLTPRKDHFVASFALHRWLKSPRVTRTQDYGPKWRAHFVPVRSVNDLDDELKDWLQESHDVVGLQQRRQ